MRVEARTSRGARPDHQADLRRDVRDGSAPCRRRRRLFEIDCEMASLQPGHEDDRKRVVRRSGSPAHR